MINDNLNERHYITKNSELLVKSSSLELNQGFSYKEIQEIQTKKPEENKETNSYQYESNFNCVSDDKSLNNISINNDRKILFNVKKSI